MVLGSLSCCDARHRRDPVKSAMHTVHDTTGGSEMAILCYGGITGTGTIDGMADTGTIGDMAGTGTVGDMTGTGAIGNMAGTGTVGLFICCQ